MLTRRSLIGTGLACCATPAVARTTRQGHIQRAYRDSIVINGNLSGPFYDNGLLVSVDVKGIKGSGITALKATLGGHDMGRAETLAQIERVKQEITTNSGVFTQILRPSDIAVAKRSGRVGIIFSFEGASMLEGDIATIDDFRNRGVLVMGLSYNLQTPFGSGTLVRSSTGLTPLGRDAIDRMNTRGITLDISHSDERTSREALAASRKPVLITHAGCSAIHAHPRNKSDELMHALADRGGVIGIYELAFLGNGSRQQSLDDYLAHMAHALDIAGEDHVGVGTDGSMLRFDTSPEAMKAWYADIARRKATGVGAPGEGPPPFVTELNRPDRMLVIAEALAKRGYGSRLIEKVMGSNFQRVFGETWDAAA